MDDLVLVLVVKLVIRLIATALFASTAGAFAWVVTHEPEPVFPQALAAVALPAPVRISSDPLPVAIDTGWVPPTWLGHSPDVLSLPHMDQAGPRNGGPNVHARAAFIYDADADEVLFERRADEVRPVASITKLVSSLALASLEPDLDREICIGREQYPTRNGARSRLSTGDCLTGWDVVGAALVASDNRAALAMAAVAGEDIDPFVRQMNLVSQQLGMHASTWSDPSGLEDDNLSTARDIAKATLAVSTDPVLAPIASAPFWDVHKANTQEVRRLNSTDHLVGREDIEILAAKTGFTETARYCFTTVVRTKSGRRVVVTLLGVEGKETRWGDMARVLQWLDQRA